MSYFRPAVDAMAGYVPGEQPGPASDIIKLNTNENPYPPSPNALQAIHDAVTERLKIYPNPDATSFRHVAARVHNVPADWIIAGNGSDEILTLLTRATCDADDLMVSPTPSYLLYRVLANIQGCRFEERSFTSSGKLPEGFTEGSKLSWVPNPNSPTGEFIPPDELLQHARQATGLLVVDEAYAEFADSHCIDLVEKCERLVVTRTLSKSHSFAGLRFGYAIAQPVVIDALRKIKDSYNCDALSIAGATAALADVEYSAQVVQKIKSTRARLSDALSTLGFTVTPSHANFVWITSHRPLKPIYEHLKQRDILIRYLDYTPGPVGLRISIGTDFQIDRLLEELKRFLDQN